jgi:hypothetical protein
VATTISDATLLNSRFDIFQFPFRFNPGTNGGNVEMGLINKSYLVTLNQRVVGSIPTAPTTWFQTTIWIFLIGQNQHFDRFLVRGWCVPQIAILCRAEMTLHPDFGRAEPPFP